MSESTTAPRGGTVIASGLFTRETLDKLQALLADVLDNEVTIDTFRVSLKQSAGERYVDILPLTSSRHVALSAKDQL